jgi:hypothetical protein
VRAWKRGEVRGSVLAAQRLYDKRQDYFVSADAALYVDLSTAIGLVAGGSYTLDVSTKNNEGYAKWTTFLAMLVVLSE